MYLCIALVLGGLLVWFGNQIHTRRLPSGSVKLSLPYNRYLVGEPVAFTIENAYNAAISVANNCPNEPLAVYRFENNQWVRIHDTADMAGCTAQMRQVKIPPHSSLTASFGPWKQLFAKPGRYRIVASIDYYHDYPYQDLEIAERPIAAAANSATSQSGGSSAAKTSAPAATAKPAPVAVATPAPTTAATPPLQSRSVKVDGGTVAVTYSSTMIYVQSITPESGYTYSGGGSGSVVRITFRGHGNEIQLTLSLSNGQLQQRVRNDD